MQGALVRGFAYADKAKEYEAASSPQSLPDAFNAPPQ